MAESHQAIGMLATLLDRRSRIGGAAALAAATALSAHAQQDSSGVPFRFHASDDALDELKRRLATTRWPEPATEQGFAQGPPLEQMRMLVDYWRMRYDWRRTEAKLARWPQYKSRSMASASTTCTHDHHTPTPSRSS